MLAPSALNDLVAADSCATSENALFCEAAGTRGSWDGPASDPSQVIESHSLILTPYGIGPCILRPITTPLTEGLQAMF